MAGREQAHVVGSAKVLSAPAKDPLGFIIPSRRCRRAKRLSARSFHSSSGRLSRLAALSNRRALSHSSNSGFINASKGEPNATNRTIANAIGMTVDNDKKRARGKVVSPGPSIPRLSYASNPGAFTARPGFSTIFKYLQFPK